MNLITIERATITWANAIVTEYHYMHRPVHPRACPFAYRILVSGQEAGVIIMATPHFTRQRDLFGFPGLPTKWQVLVISRVWIAPRFQGQCVIDQQGRSHSLPVASCALGQVLRRVQRDWIEHHPPRFPDQPYHIRLVIAYADLGQGHEGTIYKASNFRLWGSTKNTRPRHSTRGEFNGTEKRLYIRELREPSWSYDPQQGRLL
jgi:hypothetical protein